MAIDNVKDGSSSPQNTRAGVLPLVAKNKTFYTSSVFVLCPAIIFHSSTEVASINVKGVGECGLEN